MNQNNFKSKIHKFTAVTLDVGNAMQAQTQCNSYTLPTNNAVEWFTSGYLADKVHGSDDFTHAAEYPRFPSTKCHSTESQTQASAVHSATVIQQFRPSVRTDGIASKFQDFSGLLQYYKYHKIMNRCNTIHRLSARF